MTRDQKPGARSSFAMTVLAYERGAGSLAYATRYGRDLALLAKACREYGRTDTATREKLGRLLVENQVMRANGIRMLANFETFLTVPSLRRCAAVPT